MPKSILDILTAKNVLNAGDLPAIRQEAKEKNVGLEDVLYARGINERDVAEAKSELTGYPVKYLAGAPVRFEVLHEIPEESARHYKMIPLGKDEGYFDVGMLVPEEVTAQEALRFIAARINLPVRIFIITPSDFSAILQEYKGLTGEVKKAVGEFEKEFQALEKQIAQVRPEGARIVEEAPVTKIFAVILRHAVEGRGSDIHIEPGRDKVRVRFRVDGVLHTSLILPLDIAPALVTRIKVMTNLKIDETRIPQDGRFHAELAGREIDFRVSTFPTAFGEKVVIRILDPAAGKGDLASLGLDGRNLAVVEQGVRRPYGMILITGPTGSGKSTTLYAILQIINKEGVNVVSLEDPIEYYIAGVNQSQVRPEINYDFATGLRHVVRQDPDIIMVGEIRDKETAALAIHAALTGHLVLSTLHTNNAIGVIPRLIDMGVDPFLLPATLILAIGQRLARTLCPESRKKVKVAGRIKDIITSELAALPDTLGASKKVPQEIYEAEVSSECPKGTRGRIGIFEALSMTPELESIILTGPSETKIAEEARRQGMITMKQDGILKVLKGVIGLEQLFEIV